jgi:Domain of Unknown Function with PDB structure (DUF3863)/Domain of Unknown Function with PDB structure (DUF3864)
VMHTQSIHFDEGFSRNGFGWITNIWEAQLVHEFGQDMVCSAMRMWVTDTKRRWPDVCFMTFGEFGTLWRDAHPSNDDWACSFLERGSGLGDSYNNLEIEWFMNRNFRLALLRDWQAGSSRQVIDLTRYDLRAREPTDPSPDHPVKDWSLMNRINQKGLRPQDKPRALRDLAPGDLDFVLATLPQLRSYM